MQLRRNSISRSANRLNHFIQLNFTICDDMRSISISITCMQLSHEPCIKYVIVLYSKELKQAILKGQFNQIFDFFDRYPL